MRFLYLSRLSLHLLPSKAPTLNPTNPIPSKPAKRASFPYREKQTTFKFPKTFNCPMRVHLPETRPQRGSREPCFFRFSIVLYPPLALVVPHRFFKIGRSCDFPPPGALDRKNSVWGLLQAARETGSWEFIWIFGGCEGWLGKTREARGVEGR